MGELQKRIDIERIKLKEWKATTPDYVAVEERAITMFENWIEEMRQEFPHLESGSPLEEAHAEPYEEWFEKWLGKPK